VSRNAVRGDQVGTLAHLLKDHAQRKHGTDGIAVGLRVGANEEALAAAQYIEYRRDANGFNGGERAVRGVRERSAGGRISRIGHREFCVWLAHTG
jgi:hypothetical protein